MTILLQGSVGDGGQNNRADVQAVQKRLVELGFDWLSVNSVADSATVKTIKLFQSIINGRQTVGGDGRVDMNGPTYRWLNATNAPRWQLMPAGSPPEGFVNTELADSTDDHDYGTDWLAQVIVDASTYYRDYYLSVYPKAALVTINNASRPRGGDTPRHKGHETGLSCDLRLPRRDGSAGQVAWSATAYDRDAMRGILTAFAQNPLVSKVYFNDKVLIDEKLCQFSKGHDDHAHIEIRPPQRVERDSSDDE